MGFSLFTVTRCNKECTVFWFVKLCNSVECTNILGQLVCDVLISGFLLSLVFDSVDIIHASEISCFDGNPTVNTSNPRKLPLHNFTSLNEQIDMVSRLYVYFMNLMEIIS
jgi:hypothetical protein